MRRFSFIICLILALAMVSGCAKKQIVYSGKPGPKIRAGETKDKAIVRPPKPKGEQAPAEVRETAEEARQVTESEVAKPAESGTVSESSVGSRPASGESLFVRHRWKEDDSLSFLSIFYAGNLDAQQAIEAANPQIKFTGRLPQGTPVWIPEKVIKPELKPDFKLVRRPSPEAIAAATSPAQKGVYHVVEGEETLPMISAFYTGEARNAAKLALANPGLDPGSVLPVGQKVFVPEKLVLKDLAPRLVFVNRDGSSGSASAIDEARISPQPTPAPKPQEVIAPEPESKPQAASLPKPRKHSKTRSFKLSSKHKRR